MAITPPIMTYPLGTDYYDVEVFNTNWKNSLTYLDNNFLNNERVLSEQLSTSTTNVLSSEASNKLFENGVGADVLGYIEDGATHTAGTVWLSKYNKGIFKCITQNNDNFINSVKWKKVDMYFTNEKETVASGTLNGVNFLIYHCGSIYTLVLSGQTTATLNSGTTIFNISVEQIRPNETMSANNIQLSNISSWFNVNSDGNVIINNFDTTKGTETTIPIGTFIGCTVSWGI